MCPSLRLSGILNLASRLDERERHLDHLLQVGNRDPLFRRVDVRHPVREVDALEATFVEDVRVRAPAGEDEAGLAAGSPKSGHRKLHRELVSLEAIPACGVAHLDLDLALAESGGE